LLRSKYLKLKSKVCIVGLANGAIAALHSPRLGLDQHIDNPDKNFFLANKINILCAPMAERAISG